jgi:hypothetical protein
MARFEMVAEAALAYGCDPDELLEDVVNSPVSRAGSL